jgi:hypothetical protein
MSESAAPRPSTRRGPSGAARRRRTLLLGGAVLLVVVAALVVVLATRGTESAADTVGRAFGTGETVKTAQVDVRLALSGSAAGGDQPLDLGVRGPYEASRGGKAAFDLAVDLGGAAGAAGTDLGLLGLGGKTYLELGGQPFEVPAAVVDELGKDDGAQQGDDQGLSLSGLGIDPRSWLRDPERVGDERLAGEDVTHVRSGVDVDRLAADLTKLLGRADRVATAAQKKQTKAATGTLTRLKKDIEQARIDVWAADGEGALRRMKIDLTLSSGRVALDFGLSRINEPVKIASPKNALPLEQLLQAVQGATTDGKTGAAADSTDSSAYDACVTKAAGDVGELQACADLQ